MIVDSKSPSLEQMVYATLEEEILAGELARGTALGEIVLSNRLGVSRTPVRGALHRLAEDGLVEIIPNKGAVVVGISTDDLKDIYGIRMRLEGLASLVAARRITKDELAELERTVDLTDFYIERCDAERLKELDSDFHRIIFAASGNRLLAKTLTELHRKIQAYRKISLSVTDRLLESAREHREILDAIRNSDGELADKLTSLHIQKALDNILSHGGNEW